MPWSPLFLFLSVLVHLVLLGAADRVLPHLQPPKRPTRHLTMVILDPEEQPEVEAPEPEKPKFEGQIVEIAPPDQEEKPVESDYLSAYDVKVDQETRTERTMVNPEVLAREYSKEQQAEEADVMDLNVEKPSTGATAGNHRFDPNVDGSLAALPSPWQQTNKDGTQDPIPSSQREAMLSGAPQNDRLDEVVGKAVSLNTMKYPYAGYMDRIRRAVNYWWQQNLDNLPSSTRLGRPRYTTDVQVILNADGALEHIEVTRESGSAELDDCLVRAFRMAAPFANPPDGLVEKDGRVYLPDFDFTVEFTAAHMQYQGIDPRSGVQFPGILKSPR
ncbi:MAG: TonB C-terminal domain-containing protein [Myxococcota bacterium]